MGFTDAFVRLSGPPRAAMLRAMDDRTRLTLRLPRLGRGTGQALAVVLALAAAGHALAQSNAGQQSAGGPPAREVGVMALERATVPVSVILPGRAVAFQETVIRPQVGGEIVEIAYRPGRPVTAGTVLFRLNDDQLSATLSAATAAVTSAEAALENATATVARYDRLAGSGVTRADLETAQVALANARASLSAAEAERELAQLAVDRTEIRSPIDGITDIANVSVGDLVTANQGEALTTVTQLDPIYVDVSESRASVLRNRERRSLGILQPTDGREAQLILETGQLYPEAGEMVTHGRQVSPTTGTVPFRWQFANPDRLILPGQFVRVKVTIGAVQGVLVPQGPTRRSATGQLTAFVARDGIATEVMVTENGTHEGHWIVTEGLDEGDLLILDGLTNLNHGQRITTIPVKIDAEGVVREVAAADAAAPDTASSVPMTGATPGYPGHAASASAEARAPALPETSSEALAEPAATTSARPPRPAASDPNGAPG